jgi:hypothetical protein
MDFLYECRSGFLNRLYTLVRVILWLRLHLRRREIGKLGDVLLALVARDADWNPDLVELLRLFAAAVDSVEKLEFATANFEALLNILKPRAHDFFNQLIIFLEAFPLPEFVVRVLASQNFQTIIRHILGQDVDLPIVRVLRVLGDVEADFLRAVWRNPDLILARPIVFGRLTRYSYSFGNEESQRIIEAILTKPHLPSAARFAADFADRFLYSDVIRAHFETVANFAVTAPAQDLLLLEVCAQQSAEFGRDLVLRICDTGSGNLALLGWLATVANCLDDDEKQQEAVSAIGLALMDGLTDLRPVEQAAVLDKLADFLGQTKVGTPFDWEILVVAQIFDLDDIATDPVPNFLRVAVPRMDSDNFRGQVETFAAAFGAPEEADRFRRAVKFLAVCFEVRGEAREIFGSIVRVDEELMGKWPEELVEYREVFAGGLV